MKRLLTIGGLLCVSLWLVPSLVHGEEVNETRQNLKSSGLVGSLLDGVGKTVDGTVQSVSNLVETTVDVVDQNVQETSAFVTETVVPGKMSQDEPISGRIQRTAELVDKTTENVNQIVKSTAGTLKKTVADVNEGVDELPNVPIAKPVAEAAGRTVEETVESAEDVVNSTVSTVNQTTASNTVGGLNDPQAVPLMNLKTDTEVFLHSALSNVGSVVNQASNTLRTVLTGSSHTVGELPVISINEQLNFQEGKTPAVSQNRNSAVVSMPALVPEELINTEPGQQLELVEFPESTDLELPSASSYETSKRISFERQEKSNKVLDRVGVSQSNDPIKVIGFADSKPKAKELSFNQMAPSKRQQSNFGRFSLQEYRKLHNAPLVITGSTTTITSPTVSAGGGSDIVPGVLSRMALTELMYQRHWLLADIEMYSQWDHAPPGQPPAHSPFLLEIN